MKIKKCNASKIEVNLTFSGCGFLGTYYIGVGTCFQKCAPGVEIGAACGASFGALTAAGLICGVPWGEFTSALLAIVYELRRHRLGPFNPLINITNLLRSALERVIPENAYKLCSGRLFISVTRVSDGANVIVSEFKSNEELMQTLIASAFVPVFSGFIPPKVGEHRYVDGGFSNNLPILDENTITVSPFCGESDICPRDDSLQLFHVNLSNTSVELSRPNIYRFARILFPPSPEVLSMMCKQGFEDALKFLQRNDMISCTKCLAVQTTFSVPIVKYENISDQHDTYDPECKECVQHRQKAAVSNLPETVVLNFEHAIEKANKGLVNWIFQHRGMKIISIVGLPYLLGVDMVRAILRKLVEVSPDVMENTVALSKHLVHFITETVNQMNQTGVTVGKKVFSKLEIVSSYSDDNKVYNVHKEIAATKYGYESNLKPENDKNKVTIYPTDSDVSEDTYEHILEVIDHHDSLMAFYYMDDHNKMKVMEFFDVTNDSKILPDTVLHGQEIIEIKENNEENIIESWTMGNDNSLATSYITPCHEQNDTEYSQNHGDSAYAANSDPESDWTHNENVMTLKTAAAAQNDVPQPRRQRSMKKIPGLFD